MIAAPRAGGDCAVVGPGAPDRDDCWSCFYDEEWGFGASQGAMYRLSDALWLDKVLVNRQGARCR